jgi:hypothetical protein
MSQTARRTELYNHEANCLMVVFDTMTNDEQWIYVSSRKGEDEGLMLEKLRSMVGNRQCAAPVETLPGTKRHDCNQTRVTL